jgi:hypothetical protein
LESKMNLKRNIWMPSSSPSFFFFYFFNKTTRV